MAGISSKATREPFLPNVQDEAPDYMKDYLMELNRVLTDFFRSTLYVVDKIIEKGEIGD